MPGYMDENTATQRTKSRSCKAKDALSVKPPLKAGATRGGKSLRRNVQYMVGLTIPIRVGNMPSILKGNSKVACGVSLCGGKA